mgnify:CR=1 FL=1
MLYTILVEYKGGTYISQVNARNHIEALKDGKVAIEKAIKKPFIDDWLDPAPVPIDQNVGVWCASTLDSDEEGVSINIVQTMG